MESDVFLVTLPLGRRVPVLISCPHSGTEIPAEIAVRMDPSVIESPPDTDWFIDRLYDFAPAMGATLIAARFSRYVIDLNRSPDSKPLYADGRRETGLVPQATFSGKPLYRDTVPGPEEAGERLRRYYLPYHEKIRALLGELREEFGQVLFYDAHSIRRHVPAISPDPLPDLILGDGDGTSAHPSVSAAAWTALSSGSYTASRNHPFKGGYLTRAFGSPADGVHALQLEMSQEIYMDESAVRYDPAAADRLRETLRQAIGDAAAAVGRLA